MLLLKLLLLLHLKGVKTLSSALRKLTAPRRRRLTARVRSEFVAGRQQRGDGAEEAVEGRRRRRRRGRRAADAAGQGTSRPAGLPRAAAAVPRPVRGSPGVQAGPAAADLPVDRVGRVEQLLASVRWRSRRQNATMLRAGNLRVIITTTLHYNHLTASFPGQPG